MMMARTLRCLVLLATAAGAVSASGQNAATTKPDDKTAAPPAATASAPAGSPTPVSGSTAPKHAPHAISDELAATLAVGRPKYLPAKPVEKKFEEEELPDARDTDKPKNQIIRLPKVVVEGKRPPIFREPDIYTRKALGELLAKRYYSEGYLAFSRFIHYTPLRLFFPSAEQSALEQYYENERLRNMGELNQAAANAAKAGDLAGSEYIKAATKETYLRRMDWGWQGQKK